MIRLSILIPTTSDRYDFYADLMTELCRQVRVLSEWYEKDYWKYVEILKDTRPAIQHGGVSIGTKRNDLLQQATGEWLAFVDSDDMVSRDYLRTILNALESNPDCLSLRGIITTNGENPELFEHSIRYNKWETVNAPIKHLRYPNHLNVIKSSIAKQIKFPEINFSEDHAWSNTLHNIGLLKNEVYIDKVLYHYLYRTEK